MRRKRKNHVGIGIGILTAAAVAAMISGCGNGSEKIKQTSADTQTESSASSGTEETKDTKTAAATTGAEESASEEKREEKRIRPLPATLNINDLNDVTFSASFQPDHVKMDQDTLSIHMTVYDYELFDMVDISQLEKGDVLVCNGVDMPVESVERQDNGMVTVNGGLEEGGCYLMTNGDGVYYESGFDDAKSYYAIGETTLEADTDFVFTDNSDLENPGKTMDARSFAEYAQAQPENTFIPNNISVRTENGKMTEIVKNYIP